MRKRIFLISLSITVISLTLLCIGCIETFYKTLTNHSQEYLKVYMNEYSSENYSFDNTGATELSQKLGGARVTFMNNNGQVCGDSDSDNTGSNHADRQEVIDALKNGEGFSIRNSATLGKSMIYYCKRFDDGKLVRIAIYTSSQSGIILKALPTFIWLAIVDVFVCVIITYAGTFYICKPVEELVKKSGGNSKIVSSYEELEPVAEILNKKNEEINEQLEQLKKEKQIVIDTEKSKAEFIADITHEMNTPLTGIRGFAELLSTDGLPEDKRKQAINTILSQSERLTNLIKRVINMNKLEGPENLPDYPIEIKSAVNEVIDGLSPVAESRNVKLTSDLQNDLKVNTRYEVIVEIAGNLIRNAITYNVDGGEVDVSLKGNELTVSDTGIGISKENLVKIFERFYTVSSEQKSDYGFGLGLSVVKKLCDRYGWKISVESELGKGSSFKIIF